MWYWHKARHTDQWDKIESQEINPYIYIQLIHKDAEIIQWKKNSILLGRWDM